MKNPEKLIGRKVKGFNFEKDPYLFFTNEMEKYIGVVGVIKSYDGEDDAFNVFFDKENYFSYPVDQIEANLVEEENEIPTLSDGVMMLVSDDKVRWCERMVFGKKNNIYYTWDSGVVVTFVYAEPIQPTKEEQLTAILGSSEKVAEIMELFNDKK